MTERRVTVIRPQPGWPRPPVRELFDYRDLLAQLVVRDVKVRYKQTALGAAWAILQPVGTMVVFAVFFGGLAGVPSEEGPYWLFALTGLIPWTFFATGLNQAALSLVGSAAIVTKVWFPRILVPVAAMLASLVDLAVSGVLLVVIAVAAGHPPGPGLLAAPGFVGLALVTGLGMGTLLAGLNVLYRDVRYVLPFAIQIWLFATPIAYPASLVEPAWRSLYAANPLVTVVAGFRWAFQTGPPPEAGHVLISSIVALALFVVGTMALSRIEATLADVI